MNEIRFFTRNKNGRLVSITDPDHKLKLDSEFNDQVSKCIVNSCFTNNDKFANIDMNALYINTDNDDTYGIISANPVHFINVASENILSFIKHNSNISPSIFLCAINDYIINYLYEDSIFDSDEIDELENEDIHLYTAISKIGNIPVFISYHQDSDKHDVWIVYGLIAVDNDIHNHRVSINGFDKNFEISVIEPPYQKFYGRSGTTFKNIAKIFHDIKPIQL